MLLVRGPQFENRWFSTRAGGGPVLGNILGVEWTGNGDDRAQGYYPWIFCTSLGSYRPTSFGGKELLQHGPAVPLETSVLSSQWGFPLWSLSLCMFRGELFFFYFLSFFFSSIPPGDVDAAEMRGYRSARVPEVCIEFQSRII